MEVTAREEDCAGAIAPAQDVLLAVMRAVAGNIRCRADSAWPDLLRAIDATVVAAEVAVVQRRFCFDQPFGEFIIFQERPVYRKTFPTGLLYANQIQFLPVNFGKFRNLACQINIFMSGKAQSVGVIWPISGFLSSLDIIVAFMSCQLPTLTSAWRVVQVVLKLSK